MALSLIPKGPNSGSLALADGDSPANELTLSFANGDFSVSGIRETLNEQTAVEVRGQWIGNVEGARVYPTFSFTCVVTEVTSATDGTVADFLLRNGLFAANVSSKGAGHPYMINTTYTIDGTSFSESDQTFGAQHCEITSVDFAEGLPSTLSISGTIRGSTSGMLAAAERS